jgi:hypothetical protein
MIFEENKANLRSRHLGSNINNLIFEENKANLRSRHLGSNINNLIFEEKIRTTMSQFNWFDFLTA